MGRYLCNHGQMTIDGTECVGVRGVKISGKYISFVTSDVSPDPSSPLPYVLGQKYRISFDPFGEGTLEEECKFDDYIIEYPCDSFTRIEYIFERQ